MIEKYSFKMTSGNIYDVMHQKGDEWELRFKNIKRKVIFIGDFEVFTKNLKRSKEPFLTLKAGMEEINIFIKSTLVNPKFCIGKSIVFLPEETWLLLELGRLQKEKSWSSIFEEEFFHKEIIEFLAD